MISLLLAASLDLAAGFAEPPMSARPQVWWHWMNGNVTKEGITADLEAMKEIGIGGASVFDAGCNVPRGSVRFGTPEWFDILRHAAKEAKRLGIELATTTCSGWSCAGGPWMPASMGMKKLATASVAVSGGKPVEVTLPQIPNPHGFAADIAVVAFPEIGEKAGAPFVGCRFRLEHEQQWRTDGEGIVEISADGEKWTEFCRFDANAGRRGDSDHTLRYAALARPLTAAHRRVRFRFWDAETKRDLTGQIKVAESFFTTCAGVTQLNEKILDRRGLMKDAPVEFAADRIVRSKDVVDVTGFVRNGVLRWNAPAGDWRIVRLGFYANGRMNHPASDGASGFEVDKLSASALDYHFDHYVAKLEGFSSVLVDSYEAGSQNWTDGLEKEFAKRRGYEMTPFYPALAGVVIDSVAASDGFLHDFRKTVSELFCENFAGRLAERCHERGMKLILEPYGNCPCDDLDFGRHADIPQCEFWSRFSRVGDFCTDVGNARVPAYLAHYWGRRFVGAESFTADGAMGGRWLTTPFRIKAQGDRAFAEGVNRLTFHRFAHQPWVGPAAPKPGMTMGCWGMNLDRTQTWWKQGRDWMRYLGRCQWMLQEGRFVADFLFVADEEIPNRGGHLIGFPQDFDYYRPPLGYGWDICSREALKSLKRRGDRFVSPGGVEYARVITNLTEAATLPCGPDFICRRAPDGVEAEARFMHRRHDNGIDAYFVAQPNRREGIVTASFRIAGRQPELWDAETGETGIAPLEWFEKDGRTEVSWKARPSGSMFVVFRKPLELSGGWRLTFPVSWYSGGTETKSVTLAKPVDWATLEDEDMRYFSGTAEYEYLGSLDGVKSIDFGEVREFAEVFVNGTMRTTLWRPPYEFVLPQESVTNLRVRVTNLWPNRLIGDERTKKPDAEWEDPTAVSTYRRQLKAMPKFITEGKPSPTARKTFATWHHWYKDDKLRPSGIIGPVRFRRADAAENCVHSRFEIIGDWKLRVSGGGAVFEYDVEPPKSVFVTGERQRIRPWKASGSGWTRGTCPEKIRLMECTAKDALDVASVTVRDAHGNVMKRGVDYEIDEHWCAIGALPSGALSNRVEVSVDYGYYMPQVVKIVSNGRFYGSVYLTRTMKRLDANSLFPFVEGAGMRPHGELGDARIKCPKVWEKLENGEQVRILAWGDSVTDAGYLPDRECRWQKQFVKALVEKFPRARIELVENGWAGRCAKNFLEAPQSDPKHNFSNSVVNVKADLVISEFINDASLYKANAKPQFTKDYAAILQSFRDAGTEWIIVAPHFATCGMMGSAHMKFSADKRPFVTFLREFAAANGIALADTPLVWGHLHLEGVPYQPLLMNGINHPNAEGHGYFAEALMKLF